MSKKIIDKYNEYHIGYKFMILGYPYNWSSALKRENPFDAKLIFPYYGTIEGLLDDDYIAMTDGNFGWNLSELIELKLIAKDIRLTRKEKILKLKNYE
jgi:hypothetical protein